MASSILRRLDQLNEFERQPVSPDELKSGRYFAGAFAGEHIAATEFVIGALFVSFGARAFDILVGLLVGNALAVLSWTFVCVPIAMQTRLTLYWYLRRITGPAMMVIYNVLNGVLYCVLGGAMITVAASAVRIPFGIPDQTHWYPEDPRFVLVVLGIGAVVETLAIAGFRRLAQFNMVCSPWMITMFVAGALVALPLLGHVRSLGDFWRIANTEIWKGPVPGQANPIGFWHIVAFAWICNLGMHIGLTDMAIFRYAKRGTYGLYSSFGMFLGHYVAWIAAGIMGAGAAVLLKRPLTTLDSGSVAYSTLGTAGVLAVVFAGWTTANPMLYRAGLAFQVVSPGWPRWLVTLIAGAITTVAACSPYVFTKLLDFLGIYGLLLMPVGTVVVVEHWLFPRIGWTQYWVSRRGLLLNWPALAACVSALTAGFVGLYLGIVPHLFFLFIPVWILTAVVYLGLARLAGAAQPVSEPAIVEPIVTPVAPAADPDRADPRPPGEKGMLYYASGSVALASLVLCLLLPLRLLLSDGDGYTDRLTGFHLRLFWTTVVYFISSTIWLGLYESRARDSAS